ncbi:hypothetical protein K492DRAFT_192091 [Lichtheimia hyalospora FSU 10163]|nr:hypothetical protein K492DRAFT_192091 [Lichtheimia hyalospora FSU 10163]
MFITGFTVVMVVLATNFAVIAERSIALSKNKSQKKAHREIDEKQHLIMDEKKAMAAALS